MLRPIGTLPPAVYWRRRLLILGAVVLVALTVYVLFVAGGDKKQPAAKPPITTARHLTSSAPPSSGGSSLNGGPITCVPSVLGVAAAVPTPRYRVGQQPELQIQVTDTGGAPCVADLSDTQIELVVYNGESRVWSSHDCQIQPGHSPVTLTPRRPVRRSIRWSGLSSQPRCAGKRMRVGAGSYTLHARLGQVDGRPAMFTLS